MSMPVIYNIDDDDDFNTLLVVVLKKHGIKVVTHTDVKVFFNAIQESPPSACLVDLNLDTQFGAGFQIIQAIRSKLGHDIPLLVMSKRSSREDIAYALEIGANDYLGKPIDDLVLISKLKQYLPMDTFNDSFSTTELAHYAVTEKDERCDLSFDVQVKEISEFGITLCGNKFLSKGTPIYLSDPLIKEFTNETETIFLNVQNNWAEEHGKSFGAFLEFDAQDEKLLSNVRTWLLKNSQNSIKEN